MSRKHNIFKNREPKGGEVRRGTKLVWKETFHKLLLKLEDKLGGWKTRTGGKWQLQPESCHEYGC